MTDDIGSIDGLTLLVAVQHIADLEAQLAEAHELQPMSTAPENGEEVLIAVEERAGVPGRYLVGHWMSGGHCIEDHPPIEKGWYFWNGAMFDRASKPVGWLRLPPAHK